MKKILITGGCGFIGVNLVERMLARLDSALKIVDNLSTGSLKALAEVTGFFQTPSDGPGERAADYRVAVWVGDVRHEEFALQVCRETDAIVHLAASTGVIPSIQFPREDYEVNVKGTFNVLEAARVCGVKKFVFASSGASVGEPLPPIHEEATPHPLSPYGAGKLCGEAYCSAYHTSFGVETVVLRFGNVYGPKSHHKGSVVAKFIRHILAREPLPIYGDGHQTRDFICVDDLTEAIIAALTTPNIGGEIFQIATNEEHTVLEVARVLSTLAQKHLGYASPIVYEAERKGEVKRSFSDTSKAKRLLAFEPRIALADGLENTFLSLISTLGSHQGDTRDHQ